MTSRCRSKLRDVGEVGLGGRGAKIFLIYKAGSLHAVADYAD